MEEKENNNTSEVEGNFEHFYNKYKEKKDVVIKPRKKMPPESQKQLEAFERARKIRDERVEERKRIKEGTNKEKEILRNYLESS